MRLARKLFLLAAMTLTAMAMTAGNASAVVEVHSEEFPEPEVPCGTISLTVHTVNNGCHVEFISTFHIPIVAYVPSATVLFSCRWHLEAKIGENGEGYVTEADLTNEVPPAVPPCQRQACDEAETAPNPHAMLPWPIHIREAAGVESIEMRFCLRNGSPNEPLSAEGTGTQSRCTVHLPVADLGEHRYEIGTRVSEFFCEPGDFAFPVSIRNAHFTNEIDPTLTHEDIEIIH